MQNVSMPCGPWEKSMGGGSHGNGPRGGGYWHGYIYIWWVHIGMGTYGCIHLGNWGGLRSLSICTGAIGWDGTCQS